MKTFETITITQQKAVAVLSLNRPEKHNALNSTMISELTEAFIVLGSSTEIRVIVLRGNGPSFCAGADLNYMREIAAFGQDENKADALRLARLFDTINKCPKPVVAHLHGAVIGGANGLAAAADIVIADENTYFAFSEVRLGITPATISPFVIRRCGQAIARELMLTGRRFSAAEARQYMLVNHIETAENPDAVLNASLQQLLAGGPGALADCKELISAVAAGSATGDELLDYTSGRIAAGRASTEGQEGMKAFFDKRKPNWFQEPSHEN